MRKTIIVIMLLLTTLCFGDRLWQSHNYVTTIDSVYKGDTLTADTVYTDWLVSGSSTLPYGQPSDFVYVTIAIQDSTNSGGVMPTNTCSLWVDGMFIDSADSVWEHMVLYTADSNNYGTVYRYFETLPMARLRFIWNYNNGIIRIGYSLINED